MFDIMTMFLSSKLSLLGEHWHIPYALGCAFYFAIKGAIMALYASPPAIPPRALQANITSHPRTVKYGNPISAWWRNFLALMSFS